MDRRTAIATASTTARRIGVLGGRTARRLGSRVSREVGRRLAARRRSRSEEASVATPPPRHPVPSPPDTPVAAPHTGPSPADVARAVERNAAGLSRANPRPERSARPRSAPGAKLPARAGRGILGV